MLPPIVHVVDAGQLQVGVLLRRGDHCRPLGQVDGGALQPANVGPIKKDVREIDTLEYLKMSSAHDFLEQSKG